MSSTRLADGLPDGWSLKAITALDALLSLEDEGRLGAIGLTWYSRISDADPVDSYWVERVEDAALQDSLGN